jgi:hypothetical protein
MANIGKGEMKEMTLLQLGTLPPPQSDLVFRSIKTKKGFVLKHGCGIPQQDLFYLYV